MKANIFHYGAPEEWNADHTIQEQLIGGFGAEICRIVKWNKVPSHKNGCQICPNCGLTILSIHILDHIQSDCMFARNGLSENAVRALREELHKPENTGQMRLFRNDDR